MTFLPFFMVRTGTALPLFKHSTLNERLFVPFSRLTISIYSILETVQCDVRIVYVLLGLFSAVVPRFSFSPRFWPEINWDGGEMVIIFLWGEKFLLFPFIYVLGSGCCCCSLAEHSLRRPFSLIVLFLASGKEEEKEEIKLKAKKLKKKEIQKRHQCFFPFPFDTFSGNRHGLVSVPTTPSFNLSIDDRSGRLRQGTAKNPAKGEKESWWKLRSLPKSK